MIPKDIWKEEKSTDEQADFAGRKKHNNFMLRYVETSKEIKLIVVLELTGCFIFL